MRKSLFLFFILSFIVSCLDKEKIPKDILPQSKMQSVLWDMISAGEFLTGYVLQDSAYKASESNKLYGQVLQINHITREEFDKSWQYYRKHPVLMKVILDSLSSKKVKPALYGQGNDSLQKNDSLRRSDSLHRTDSLRRSDSLHISDSLHKNDSLQGKMKTIIPVQKKEKLIRKKIKRKKPIRIQSTPGL